MIFRDNPTINVSYNVAPGLLIKPEEVMEAPHTVYVNNFDEEASKLFIEDFTKATNSIQPIIPIIIDSYGGDVYSLLSMIDVIENSSKPVATICTGKAMSCGAILLSCGTKGHRYIGNHATVMIHDVSAYSDGKFEEVKSNARETTRLQKEMFNILDKNADKYTGYFDRLVFRRGRSDWYMKADEALKHGIVDHIGIPKFKVDILTVCKFSLDK